MPQVIDSDVTLELETTACCMCGATEGATRFEGHDVEFRTCRNRFRFIACSTCDHVYLSPRPRADEMGVIYSNYLTSNRESAYYPSPMVSWIKDRVFDRRRLGFVLRHLGEDANVLDVGAGCGRLLRLVQQISPHALNLFANDIAFDPTTREELASDGIAMLEGEIETLPCDARFDAVLGIHVIEHVLDPPAVFDWIAAHMNPGAVLYFETPDVSAMCGRIFRDKWGMTHFPRHINLFSKRHLGALATQSGLEIVKQGNTTSAPGWNMSIRNSLGMDALSKKRSLLEVFNYSNPVTLGAFTGLDLVLLAAGVPTSTQTLLARRPG